MLTKPSQSVLSVLSAFGTETTFGWNQKFGRMNYLLLRENEMVNICCCENFGQGCEEMLTKPSQSEVLVLYAFGTKTMCGRN